MKKVIIKMPEFCMRSHCKRQPGQTTIQATFEIEAPDVESAMLKLRQHFSDVGISFTRGQIFYVSTVDTNPESQFVNEQNI